MKWRHRQEPTEPPRDPGMDEAHEALEQAIAQWPDVRKTVGEMRTLRKENHLGLRVHIALGGGKR